MIVFTCFVDLGTFVACCVLVQGLFILIFDNLQGVLALIMTVFSIYIINKAGGLIYQYDHQKAGVEMEKTFRYVNVS